MTLLVNEAATNAVKHSFSKGFGSHFEVSLAKEDDGRLCLTLRDDGPGFDLGKNEAPPRSFGMSIMRTFASQLGGSLEIANTPGATLVVEFPEP